MGPEACQASIPAPISPSPASLDGFGVVTRRPIRGFRRPRNRSEPATAGGASGGLGAPALEGAATRPPPMRTVPRARSVALTGLDVQRRRA